MAYTLAPTGRANSFVQRAASKPKRSLDCVGGHGLGCRGSSLSPGADGVAGIDLWGPAFAYSRALLWGAVRFRIAGWWRAALLGGLLGIVGYVLCSASMGFALFVTNASSATGRLEDPILGSFGPINFVLFWVLTLAFASYGVLPLLATCLGMIAFMLCRRPRHAHA